VRTARHEVMAPDVSWVSGAKPKTRAIGQPHQTPLGLSRRHLEPILAPDSLYPLVIHPPAFPSSTAAVTQSQFRGPRGLSFDAAGTRLFVADFANHRVMVFDVASITNSEIAIPVLGQPNFTAATSARRQSGMKNPHGVSIDPVSNRLFAADTRNHRATSYDVATITDGENAVNVLGQANFTSGSAATAQNRLSSPNGVALSPPPPCRRRPSPAPTIPSTPSRCARGANSRLTEVT